MRYVLTPTIASFELGSRELQTPFYSQVGGLDEQGKRVGNMRLGQARRTPST